MSNNIRDFRNAGASQASGEAETSNKGFYILVLAIPVVAVIAGLGYKPLIEMRGKNVAAVQQAEADMEARRRAENPMYALMNAPRNEEGLIDPNVPIRFGNGPSPEVAAARKMVNDYARRPLNAKEFLGRVDAKAANFTPSEMEMLKYKRANWALSTCSHVDLRQFYQRQNKGAYERLKAKQDKILEARSAEQQAKFSNLEINKIENKTQALAFVASGGANRHMEAMSGVMQGLSEFSDGAGYKIKARKQRFNKTGCMQVRTIIQSGSMTVKTNLR